MRGMTMNKSMKSLYFLTTTSPGWPDMWNALSRITGDYADCNPENGECWQYMGTVHETTFLTPTYVHQFRHRDRLASARVIGDKHCRGRYYVDIHAKDLTLVRLTCREYHDPDRIPAALADSRAIGERTAAGRDRNRLDRQIARRDEYLEAFDGFSVTSDADPGWRDPAQLVPTRPSVLRGDTLMVARHPWAILVSGAPEVRY